MRPARLLALLVVIALGAAACDDQASSSTSRHPTDTPRAVNGCLTSDEAELSWYDDGDLSAAVGIVGSGDAGVVISYEMAGTVCPWLPLARDLADAGITALVYERIEDFDPVEYVPGLVDVLRDHGVETVGLVGGSVGGMASVDAAAEDDTIAAVVSLSGADDGTISSGPRVQAPLLMVVAANDEPFASAARATADAVPDARLVVVDGNAHASVLLSVDRTIAPRVVGFLTRELSAG